MTHRIPVVIISQNMLSGVTTWALNLQQAFSDHPKYRLLVLNIGPEPDKRFDINVPNLKAAYQVLSDMTPLIVIPNYFWNLYIIGVNKDVRCIGMCHADDEQEYYQPLSLYQPFISSFIAVSEECTRKLKQYIPGRVQSIANLPYGVVIPEKLERSYQVTPIRLIYGGRIIQHQKRVFDFVPLVENLLKLQVNFTFDIIGEGSDLDSLRQVLKSVDTQGSVHFHGQIEPEKMNEIWAKHDIFVQVSNFEGTSISMLEAMAQGTVPVVTQTSGVRGVIESGKNGITVPIGDMDTMAQVIANLAANRDLLTAAGKSAYKKAREFSLENYTIKFSAVLDRALSLTPAEFQPENFYDILCRLQLDLMADLEKSRNTNLGQNQQIAKLWTAIENLKKRNLALKTALIEEQAALKEQQAALKEQQAALQAQLEIINNNTVVGIARRLYHRLLTLKIRLFLRNLRIQLFGR